ncbi:MAG TPA: carboxypeptidase regulatory-like domain-containing protein [Terriglobales bacterium]|nr:carboxypeptidase regulatory-like domain-containing protein [Terriglobales bacterium]
MKLSMESISPRSLQIFLTLIAVIALTSALASAQTSATGLVIGTVTDPSGAVVPNAQVTLTNTETNQTATAASNSSGGFTFANVAPGSYRLTVTAQGFQTATVNGVAVDVNKTFNAPVQLAVGGTTNVVEVQATAHVELQTSDAQLGNVISLDAIDKLPSLRRDAQDLLAQQPGVNPSGANASNQVRVTGAIDDENTFTLDGIDITENIVASRTTIPTPDDAVEEFRVDVANPNANFDRSTGGQVNLVARSGSNKFHGSGYEWHQNDELNANSWDNNFLHLKRPELKDNRFGGRIGGPIQHDKTFFFGMYEGRRFPNVQQISRFVPTDTLKQGILRFKDASGNIVSYNLANSALCSAGACDPRGLGISPTVKAFWGLEPTGNDPTQGDGLNTIGFRGNVLTPTKTDYTLARLDHTFSQRFQFYGSYTYYRLLQLSNNQVDIRSGTPVSVVSNPNRGDLISAAMNMQLRPTLLNVARWGWVRNRDAADATSPTEAAGILNLPGTNSSAGPIALLPGISQTGLIDAPIDLDTQRARFQADFDKDIQYNDDLTWLRGRHQIQTGGNLTVLPFIHERADKVVGSLTSLVAQMDADVSPGGLTIPSADRPPTCNIDPTKGTVIAANCLQSSDTQTWDRLYAASLGLLDNIGVLAVRDGSLNPLPLGTPLINSTHQKAYYFYGQDTFRWTPTFTVTAGLAYGWQTPPSEDLGRQTIMIDASTGQPLTANAYMAAKASAAQAGQIYNPTLGYVPIKSSGQTVYKTDWKDVAPRLALAWNPGPKRFVGKFLGERKTVIRAGAGITYDRINTVQSVLIPMLGVGFGQNVTVVQPPCTISGAPGANCASGSGNVAASVYRVGVDGSIPLPTVPPASNPVIPTAASVGRTNFGETLSFQDDPNLAVGRSYTLDFSIQRELPGNMVIEVAYAGHLARHLPQGVNFAASPYFFKDPTSSQTFAQAFDSVATALRSGTNPFNAPVQPWFENQLAGVVGLAANATACVNPATKIAGPCPNATALVASANNSNFINGNVASIFLSMGSQRSRLGLPAYNNRQVEELFMRTYEGTSNYHGMLVTLRKRTQFGLTFNANYTLSKSLDETIINQNNAGYYANSFNPRAEYGPSTFDRRHVFSANVIYDLPFGRGKRFSAGRKLDNVIGGWYMSHVFQAFTGTPLIFTESSQVWGGGIIFPGSTGMMPTGPVPATGLYSGVAGGNAGTTAVGVTGNPATGGTGLNLFANPAAAWSDFTQILLSQNDRSGRGKAFYGEGFWNDDMEVGKNTKITERLNFKASADFFNVFNHPNFQNPSLSLTSPRSFGVISSQFIPGASSNRSSGSRWIQLGARFEF